MKIGFDYWQCISHYPDEFRILEDALVMNKNEVVVISAVGSRKVGTVLANVLEAIPDIDDCDVHEVVFKHPRESPQLKLAKCQELGVQMFFDDRKDVCDLLNQHGILAFQVPRKNRGTDIGSEQI